MTSVTGRRSVAAVLLAPNGGDAWMLRQALDGLAADHTVLAPPDGQRFGIIKAAKLALMTAADLVLLVGGEVRPAYSDVAGLLDGYEAGARVVVGDRRLAGGRMTRPMAGLTFGLWRHDLGSPVRLYDSEALGEVISHLPAKASHPTLLMGLVEHRLRFAVKEIRLRNAGEAPPDDSPLTALVETVTGMAELLSFRGAARAIR